MAGSVGGPWRRAGLRPLHRSGDGDGGQGLGPGTHGVDVDAEEMLMEKEQGKQATFIISGPREPLPGEAALTATSLAAFQISSTNDEDGTLALSSGQDECGADGMSK